MTLKRLLIMFFAAALFSGCNTQDCSCSNPDIQTIVHKDKAVIPETNDMQEVYQFIKNAQTYYIATVEDGQPRVRPFGTIHIFDGKLYFQTGKKKKVAHQIDSNPRVEICAFDGERWIRLSGEVAEDSRVDAQASMLDAYPNLKSMYQAGDGNTVVYYFKDATATISSFAAPERTIKF